jgi:NADP-dependent 3-hydroxy acid dehydrogenase YdfG
LIGAGKSDEPGTHPCATNGHLARNFAGQTAIVTGASSGIGRAIADELAARGASLCLLGRRPEALEEVAARLCENARKWIYRVDLNAGEEIENFAAEFVREGGQADILVHSAGVIYLGNLERASIDDFDRQLNTNVRAPCRLTKALLPLLRSRCGQIVFINSNAGVSAVPGSGQYSATKHALKAVADSLRAEVSGQVRVLSLFAGTTATPMQASLHTLKGRAYVTEKLIQPGDVASLVVHALGLPRTIEVTEMFMRPAAAWNF